MDKSRQARLLPVRRALPQPTKALRRDPSNEQGSKPSLASTPTITMRYSNDKEIAATVRKLLNSGWRYMAGKKHGKIIAPNGRKLPVPGTPSDWRASMNFKRDVRRLALVAQP